MTRITTRSKSTKTAMTPKHEAPARGKTKTTSPAFRPPTTSVTERPSASGPRPDTGLGKLVALLARPEGATIAVMTEATGWQAHSVRGAIAGALKKKHGLAVESVAQADGRVYRLATPAEVAG